MSRLVVKTAPVLASKPPALRDVRFGYLHRGGRTLPNRESRQRVGIHAERRDNSGDVPPSRESQVPVACAVGRDAKSDGTASFCTAMYQKRRVSEGMRVATVCGGEGSTSEDRDASHRKSRRLGAGRNGAVAVIANDQAGANPNAGGNSHENQNSQTSGWPVKPSVPRDR